ncbi:uncharacterized protein LOC120297529 [Crotalus tigris]|uniref:uncharacterized protein LOC120297529 n=1 Tax=Crotalus tigris TaxID=88082 RepID=UPI00192F4A6E|nr:uncharacterized protein LOC120297529 [Crotalus tigris]
MDGLDKGLSTNTIHRQVAALAMVITCGNDVPLAHHPMVRSFLKGANNARPPTVHRYPSWDLHQVLQALVSSLFEPIDTCLFKQLSMKVAFLVAVTSAKRISELHALSVRKDLCIFHNDRVTLRLDPSFVPKVNSLYHRSQEIILPDFCPNPSNDIEMQWNKLDVHRALHCYIQRTSSSVCVLKSEALFVSFHPSSLGQKVSSSTIGRWIRACISLAYQTRSLQAPRHITAHSTRGAATSAVWVTQACIEEICRAATWSSPSSFVHHYKMDKYASSTASFGCRVLEHTLTSDGTQAQTASPP